MGATNVKNDIKTLFLTVNTLIAFAFGILPVLVSFEMMNFKRLFGRGPEPTVILATFVFGLVSVCVTALGSYGAVFEKNTILNAYLVLSGLVATLGVGAAFQLYGSEAYMFGFAPFYLCVMITVMALAGVLRKQVIKEFSPCAPPAIVQYSRQ